VDVGCAALIGEADDEQNLDRRSRARDRDRGYLIEKGKPLAVPAP
jgi:hypothetical protein